MVVSLSASRLKRIMTANSLQRSTFALIALNYFVIASANDSLVKCCELNQLYDLSNRECISASHHTQKELIFGRLRNFGAPKCDNDSVMVELDSEKFAIHLQGDILQMPAYGNNSTDWVMTSFCVDDVALTSKQTHWMAKACRPLSVCDHIPCVRKCCGDGEKMYRFHRDRLSTCVSHSKGIQPKFHHIADEAIEERTSEVFGVINGQYCQKYQLQPDEYKVDAHHLDVVSGHLYKPVEELWVKHSDYCIDVYADKDTGTEMLATFVCFENIDTSGDWVLVTMYLISLVFLGLTLAIFYFLPLTMSVQKISMIHYVACLFVGFLFLSINWLAVIHGLLCKLVGYLMYLGFISALSWLSVMCFEMWLTSRLTSSNFATGIRKFSVVSTYAWGVPAILFLIVVLMDIFRAVDDEFLPNMGSYTCWIHPKTAFLIYFLTPAGIMISANCILCVLTIGNYKKISKQTSKSLYSSLPDASNLASEHFGVLTYCKIVVVMGVPWVFEILSAIFSEPKQLWMVTDMINSLQGFFIFIVFVLDRRVLMELKAKFCKSEQKQSIAVSMTDLEQRTAVNV